MAATIKIKNSSTAGAAPTSSDLVQGELAVNVTDKRLFTENSGGTVVELGTNPSSITLPDGSASAPTLLHSGDTNTGLFFPAADTVGITTGGSERLRLDSSGNLGLGVTPGTFTTGKAIQVASADGGTMLGYSAAFEIGNNWYFNSGYKYGGTGTATRYVMSVGAHQWYTAASGTAGNAITFTQAMTLDASGNLGIGTTSPTGKLQVNGLTFLYNEGSSTSRLLLRNTTTGGVGGGLDIQQIGNDASISNSSNGYMSFSTNGTERARIDSSGNLLVGTTSNPSGARLKIEATINDHNSRFDSSASTGNVYGPRVALINQSPNNTTSELLTCADSSGNRAVIRSNGGLANYSANNVNLSDRREKTNFAPAGNYLAKICAIPVQTFNYIDQNLEEDDGLTLGVVAQDVQAVAPELVMESNWAGKDEEPKMRLSIYQTDLQYALMKALQELNAKFEAYKAAHP